MSFILDNTNKVSKVTGEHWLPDTHVARHDHRLHLGSSYKVRKVRWHFAQVPTKSNTYRAAWEPDKSECTSINVVKYYNSQYRKRLDGRLFNEYATKWRQETGGYSTSLHRSRNENYKAIIKMGKRALPFIFADLMREPDYWFDALQEINKVDPIPDKHYGNLKKMTADWLKWGTDNGYINSHEFPSRLYN